MVATLIGVAGLADVAAAGDSALSAHQWRAKANALCRRANRHSDTVRRDAFRGLKRDQQPSLAQMTAYVKGVAPIVRGLVHDIDQLHEPKHLAEKVGRFLATARREVKRLVADPSLGLEGNPFSDSSLRASALDLKACT